MKKQDKFTNLSKAIAMVAVAILLGVFAAGCRSALPSMPADAKQKGALMLAIESKSLVFAQRFQKVWIAPVGADLKSTNLIESNWSYGNRHYFLGIEPGKYGVVYAYLEGQSSSSGSQIGNVGVSVTSKPVFHAFMNEAAVQRTAVEVGPGKLVLGGYFLVRFSTDISAKTAKTIDPVARHYAEQRRPTSLTSTGFLGLGKTGSYVGTIVNAKKDAAAMADLLKEARGDIGKSPWNFLLP